MTNKLRLTATQYIYIYIYIDIHRYIHTYIHTLHMYVNNTYVYMYIYICCINIYIYRYIYVCETDSCVDHAVLREHSQPTRSGALSAGG